MSQTPDAARIGQGPAGPRLGVMEAVRMGWRLMMADFWRLWVVAFVFMVVMMGANMLGIVATVLVLPPMLAGLFHVVARRIDGGPAEVGDVFAGFKERFGQSVVGLLPLTLGSVVFAVLVALVIAVLVALGIGIAVAAEGEDEVVAVVVIVGVLLLLAVELVLLAGLLVFGLFFRFVPAAVWDHPESGWAAAKASARLVRDHFLPMLGLLLLFWLIGMAAELLGMLACCVGVFFTVPAVMAWYVPTIVYLYRSWTGRPLAVPAGGENSLTPVKA